MNFSIIHTILKRLKTQKGIRAIEFVKSSRDEFEEKWERTDAYVRKKPTYHYYLDEIKIMADAGLIEAYLNDGTLLKASGINPENFEDITLFVSPNAVKIEYIMQLNLTDRPIFGAPNKHQRWPELFMLMPFVPEMKPIFDDHVKKVASEFGLTSARADDFFTGESIMQDVWSAIYHAKVVVADCTSRNPNVFYEIGIAHTLGRESILISQSINDIPFDLRHLRILIYKHTPRGMAEMEKDLRFALTSLIPQ